MIGLGAMVIIIASTFMPMLDVNAKMLEGFEGLLEKLQNETSLWKSEKEGSSTVGIIIIVLASLMGLFSFLANKKHLFSIGTLLFSALLMLISMKWFRDIKESKELLTMGTGLILFLAGSGLGVISSFLGFMKK